MDVKFQFNLLSQKELSSLRGGFAEILSKEEENSQSGDGAKYVCCIAI